MKSTKASNQPDGSPCIESAVFLLCSDVHIYCDNASFRSWLRYQEPNLRQIDLDRRALLYDTSDKEVWKLLCIWAILMWRPQKFRVFWPPPPLSCTEFTQPRSFCLLFGDPPPPPTVDVIYGCPLILSWSQKPFLVSFFASLLLSCHLFRSVGKREPSRRRIPIKFLLLIDASEGAAAFGSDFRNP